MAAKAGRAKIAEITARNVATFNTLTQSLLAKAVSYEVSRHRFERFQTTSCVHVERLVERKARLLPK